MHEQGRVCPGEGLEALRVWACWLWVVRKNTRPICLTGFCLFVAVFSRVRCGQQLSPKKREKRKARKLIKTVARLVLLAWFLKNLLLPLTTALYPILEVIILLRTKSSGCFRHRGFGLEGGVLESLSGGLGNTGKAPGGANVLQAQNLRGSHCLGSRAISAKNNAVFARGIHGTNCHFVPLSSFSQT